MVASNFAEERGFKYFETSAKDATNVDEAFNNLGNMLLKRIERKFH